MAFCQWERWEQTAMIFESKWKYSVISFQNMPLNMSASAKWVPFCHEHTKLKPICRWTPDESVVMHEKMYLLMNYMWVMMYLLKIPYFRSRYRKWIENMWALWYMLTNCIIRYVPRGGYIHCAVISESGLLSYYFNRAVKLPWIFPGAPLKVNGAPGNIQGNLTALLQLCLNER